MPRRGNARATPTKASDARDRLIDAGRDVLLEHGYLGATARVIAERAGVATGNIHYHFASVDELLAASLERATSTRVADYQRLIEGSPKLSSLAAAAAAAFAEDRDAGRFRLLAQMLAGAASGGPLAGAVTAQTEPWIDLTDETLRRFLGDSLFGLVKTRDLALALVALFVGLELLDQVDPDRFDAGGLFDAAPAILGLIGGLIPEVDDDDSRR